MAQRARRTLGHPSIPCGAAKPRHTPRGEDDSHRESDTFFHQLLFFCNNKQLNSTCVRISVISAIFRFVSSDRCQ